MICPNCRNPYSFIDKREQNDFLCLKCGHRTPYQHPDYTNYHERLYTNKNYRRDSQTDPQMKFILQKLAIMPTDIVLDLGCGVGDYTKEIHTRTYNVTGLDRDVANAEQKFPYVKFVKHDCNDELPFPDRSIDKITAINVIEHLRNFELFLSDCKRVLKINGMIALTTANLDFFLHDYFFDKTHLHEWSISEFKEIVEGFFVSDTIQKSSAMFNYYPFNLLATKLLKPDLVFIGTNRD